jgi:hypothetical protein
MTKELLRHLPTEQWDHLEKLLKDFEAAWQRGERPSVYDYLHQSATMTPSANSWSPFVNS